MVPRPIAGMVKMNLGCGLAVAKDWLNIDGSLNALIASWPTAIHKLICHVTGAKSYYSCDKYCTLLRNNIFIHHDLSYGIPYKDETADFAIKF